MNNGAATRRHRVPQLWVVYALGAVAALTIVARVFSDTLYARFDDKALYLLIIAGVAVLFPYILMQLPRLQRMKVGDLEFELGDLEQSLESIPSEKRDDAYDDIFSEFQPASEVSEAPPPSALPMPPAWTDRRSELKRQSRDVFLAHVLRPSDVPGQEYDVFVFLSRSSSSNLADVASADFFFGRYWGNRVFSVNGGQKRIGVATAAYGPFLAICRIQFSDGHEAIVDRLIDFEMARLLAPRA